MPDVVDGPVCCDGRFVVWEGEIRPEAVVAAAIPVCMFITCSQPVCVHFFFYFSGIFDFRSFVSGDRGSRRWKRKKW